MIEQKVVIRKVWRSELVRMAIFVIFCVSAPLLSRQFPGSVITGPLFSLGNQTVLLSFPLYWLFPFVSFVDLVIRIFNVRYVVDPTGIEAWDGILSLRQSITRVRHEDVRSIETDQSLIQRFLDVGNIYIGTAATGGVEVVFKGISMPKKVQTWLQTERDEVQKKAKRRALTSNMEVSASEAGEEVSELDRPRVMTDNPGVINQKI
jgi:uncharacterized membrane protein YdbT with pleckstrin-like domain